MVTEIHKRIVWIRKENPCIFFVSEKYFTMDKKKDEILIWNFEFMILWPSSLVYEAFDFKCHNIRKI